MLTAFTQRPRDVDAIRAGAILYGDLGTSKAYVIGLALAIAGFSSFWLILAVSILCILVGINYIVICRCYPNGGGVYASVRNRSEVLALVGAFFIIADYVITASLSGLAAFSYFQVANPLVWTCLAILCVGGFNYFGPKFTGRHAFTIFIITLTCLFILAFFSIPHLGDAVRNTAPLEGGFWKNWKNFVSVIVALSGVESIANITGVMQLDPGTTRERPSVKITATRAITWVILEVAIFTTFFSLTSLALKNLSFHDGNVFHQGVAIRDFILRYLGETFVGDVFGAKIGLIFGWIISIAIGILLLSAVNTAINGLVALQYILSQDGELHFSFQKLNRYGVPVIPLIIATVAPVIILIFVRNIPSLAELYAVGFVGAIATNLSATSTDFKRDLKKYERIFMAFSALILIAIEFTLFIDKPRARLFVLVIVLVGLLLRSFAKEWKGKKAAAIPEKKEEPPPSGEQFSILCVVEKHGKALSYAMKAAEKRQCPLYVMYLKDQRIVSDIDTKKSWEDDKDATSLFEWIENNIENAKLEELYYFYAVTDSAPSTILKWATKLQANLVIMEFVQKGMFEFMQVRLVREVNNVLPDEIDFIVIP